MSWPTKDNPKGCVNPSLRGNRTCTECYWDLVDENNTWRGSQSCWNAQCLVLDWDKLSPAQQECLNGNTQ